MSPSAQSRLAAVLEAPAKLNLGLRVTGLRPDGYHEIDSVFVPLELWDELKLQVEVSSGTPPRVEIAVSGVAGGEVPADERNLAVRAGRAFLEAASLGGSLKIHLEKRIPSGAGLGGGSSDAAAVLRGLSDLFPGEVSARELARIALGIGADVPYFLDPQPARVRGIGERIDPLPGYPPFVFLLVNPGKSLATAEVYKGYDAQGAALTGRGPGSTMRSPPGGRSHGEEILGLLQQLLHGDREGQESQRRERAPFQNDLEPAAFRLCPAIGEVQEQMRAAGAIATGMSGSGATAFGLFLDEQDAERALSRARFPAPTWARVVVSRSSGESTPQDTMRGEAP